MVHRLHRKLINFSGAQSNACVHTRKMLVQLPQVSIRNRILFYQVKQCIYIKHLLLLSPNSLLAVQEKKKKEKKKHPRKIDYSKHVIMCHENHVRVALEWSGKLKTEALLLFKLLYGPLATLWEFSMQFALRIAITLCRDVFTSILSTRVSKAARNALQFSLTHTM